jgi:hypothetical protein
MFNFSRYYQILFQSIFVNLYLHSSSTPSLWLEVELHGGGWRKTTGEVDSSKVLQDVFFPG